MKRLIRHKTTGKYFADGEWRQAMEQAQQFDTLAAAVQAAVRYHLTGAEVILQVGERPSEIYDVRMDLLGGGERPMGEAGAQPGDGVA